MIFAKNNNYFQWLVVFIALIVNLGTFYTLYDVLPSYTSSSWNQIPSAYSFYKYGTLSAVHEEIKEKTQIVIPLKIYSTSLKPTTNDTIGYAALVGILWKITGSLNLIDIQILQILLFCLMIFFIYQIFFLLFNNKYVAFYGSLLLIASHQFILLNIIPARDIWGFYGGVIFSYILLKAFLLPQYSFKKIMLGSVFFSFCQFLRPNIFGQLLTLNIMFLLLVYLYKKDFLKQAIKIIGITLMVNILFFWVPFISFNKFTYDRYFVGPLGHGLLSALGSVENPWNLKCDDNVIAQYVNKTESATYFCGSPEYNDAGTKIFIRLCKENPSIYIKSIIKNMKDFFFYIIDKEKIEDRFLHFFEKINKTLLVNNKLLIIKCIELLGDFLKIFAIFGILLLYCNKKYISLIFLLGGVLLGAWILLFSHFEERYVVPFLWPLAGFSAYFFVSAFEWIKGKIKSKKIKKQIIV